MSWVKRNLYFLVSSVVAVALLGLAGYYFYSNYNLNNDNHKKLDDAYAELTRLSRANQANDKVDNIKAVREQLTNVLSLIEKDRNYFLPIPPIPNPTNGVVTKDAFASELRKTIVDLQNAAAIASVTLPPKYGFSFQAQRDVTIFPPGSLEPLSVQLGDIKAICAVLFQAKINSLDNLRRERVSTDDLRGLQSDYLEKGSVTNQLAVLTPYEVAFHCFSADLAAVLAGFAGDPHGFIVKAMNIESGASEAPAEASGGAMGFAPGGMMPGAPTAPTVTKGGLPVMLDEKQLKVTLVLQEVKLLPKK